MDWQALVLSLRLGAATLCVLLPPAILLARWLATTTSRWKPLVETLVILPLVLPPTVLGFYLLSALGPRSPVGRLWETLTGGSLVFSFEGLVAASVLVNIPFAVQPAQRGFEAVGADLRAAAATCGLSPFAAFRRVDLPLAAPGLLTGAILAFAHTLGEFGVVLMVGGAIPGETKTLSLSIYDRVQALDSAGASAMAALLLVIAVVSVGLAYLLTRRKPDVGA